MNDFRHKTLPILLACGLNLVPVLAAEVAQDAPAPSPSGTSAPEVAAYASPTALAATRDGKTLFVACATASQVAFFDTAAARIACSIPVPASPSGLVLSKDDARLYVTCAAPESTVCIIDVAKRCLIARIPAGHTAMSPVLSPDEQTLYVCNRFNDDVSVINLAARRETRRIRVEREPVAAAITPDGKTLVVANHLHPGRANHWHLQTTISLIDTLTGDLVQNVGLGLGASMLRGVAVSPDGRFAAVTHLRSMFWFPTTGIELGRMNGNALTIVDLQRRRPLGVVLLDQTGRGVANPWAVAWTPDGKTIAVSHAGASEISLVDAPVEADPASFFSLTIAAYAPDGKEIPPPPRHPVRVRCRIPLDDEGPRALAVAGSQLYVANYFSDTLSRIDLNAARPIAESLPLWPSRETSLARRGEMLFNDGRLCAQGWQSCASCHTAEARTDALSWDLLNDGIANPKKTKSLVWAHQTGRAMALGVRANAAEAVRAGIHHILFAEQPPEVPAAIDAWLQSLQPVPSPRLVHDRLSAAAERGKELFLSPRTGCASCHPPPLFTDCQAHDVGTASQYMSMWGAQMAGVDKPTDRFYTPALVELWRTAPYLHDGSVPTLRDIITAANPNDRHGRTSKLTEQEINDLAEYLASL